MRRSRASSSGASVRTRTTPPPLLASFTVNTQQGSSPLAVSFADTSAGLPTGWCWTWGDGGSLCPSTNSTPAHTYTCGTATCSYTASLYVSRSGFNSATVTKTISVGGPIPVCTIAPTSQSGAGTSMAVSFSSSCTNSPTSWCWNFGAGTAWPTCDATTASPSKTYTCGLGSSCSYTVKFTATNATGTSAQVTGGPYALTSTVCTVPSFVGMSVANSTAITAINSKWTTAGFGGSNLYFSPSNGLPASKKTVLTQSKAANSFQDCGTTITLTWG